jgi:hypothetical protein
MIAPNSIVSTNTIEPVIASIRRIGRGYARPTRPQCTTGGSLAAVREDAAERLRPRQGTPLGVRLPPKAASHAAGIHSVDSCSRTKRNAPSRCRRRPAHPIDLRRSDCRAGEPSTFGAPCSVHSERYWLIWPTSSAVHIDLCANCDKSISHPLCRDLITTNTKMNAKMHRVGGPFVRSPD